MTEHIKLALYGNPHTGKTVVTDWNVTFNKKGELIKMTKREQLKVAFKGVLTKLIEKYMDNTWLPDYNDRDADANAAAGLLLKEVSIRTPLK